MLKMKREELLSEETVIDAYEMIYEWKSKDFWTKAFWTKRHWGHSIHDNLEKFFLTLQNRLEIDKQKETSFLMEKLDDEEFLLVEEGNEDYLEKYADYFEGGKPMHEIAEQIAKDASDLEFVRYSCKRVTFPFKIDSEKPMRTLKIWPTRPKSKPTTRAPKCCDR